ncbi:hypothetical protein DP16_1940 [Stenotrophomonas maltophilia]|nr:hypothetical protein DP16_1940 [Stenotrophomonas maltophilia]SNW09317.1 Uncharacterised protein [Stenotrophomonas maltophilia]
MTKRSAKKKRSRKNSNRTNLARPSRFWSSKRPRATKHATPKAWWRSLWDKIPWRFAGFRLAEWLWSNLAKVWDWLRDLISS